MTENIIIIGGGPSGISASIYNARAGLDPVVLAGSPPGGQLMLTSEVENYPGFESVLGSDLIEKMRTHSKKFGTRFIDENVTGVDFSVKPFKVFTASKTYETKSVIISTGAKAIWLGLESENRLLGKGVSACATCDGFFFKGKSVAVVGGGDTAMEEALTLSKFAAKVYIIHRRSEFRASKIMQDRVKNTKNIHIIYNAQVSDILGHERVEGIKVKISPSDKDLLKKNKEELEKVAPKLLQMKVETIEKDFFFGLIPIDGIFVAIGHRPDTSLFKGMIDLDSKGYIITKSRMASDYLLGKKELKAEELEKIRSNEYYETATSVDGVFASGDCVDYVYRQATTSVGTGVAAALDAQRWLEINS